MLNNHHPKWYQCNNHPRLFLFFWKIIFAQNFQGPLTIFRIFVLKNYFLYPALVFIFVALSSRAAEVVLSPLVVTEPVRYDTDDPAIWINPIDPDGSLIIGTDKDADGALYVFDLHGKIVQEKVVRGLLRPNNVDIAYGVLVGGQQQKPVFIPVGGGGGGGTVILPGPSEGAILNSLWKTMLLTNLSAA